MNIDDYLDQLQKSESIFPMDSFSSPRRKKVIKKYIYPKRLREQNQSTKVKRALIDFDGPIHKYSKGYLAGLIYDVPSEGVKEVIDWLKENGYQIVIFTSRVAPSEHSRSEINENMSGIKKYLKKYNIHYDLITAEKLAAEFYVDDLAIHFDNWNSVKREVIKRMNLGG